jgi:cardiolipin synthase
MAPAIGVMNEIDKIKEVDEEKRGRRALTRSIGLARRQFDPPEVLRFQPGHRIHLFSRGRMAFEAMLEAIDGAKQFIHLETYILRADETGRRVISHLAARAEAGVSVRLIFDALGSRGLDRSALGPLEEAGGTVAEFNPPSQWLWRFRPRQRDHRKILLVDGRVGFLGGLNIADEYVAEDSEGPTWRDAHLRLEGPTLTELEALFIENWFRCGGESFEWRSLFDHERLVNGDRCVAILADGPSYRRRRMRSFFLEELRRAKSHVLLVSPYFAPGSKVLDALSEASDRGVRVELLLAGHTDHPLLRRAVREIVPKLLRRGVLVFEDPRRMMHAKLAVFDDALAVIGTSNLDRQSLHHSCEVNAVIDGQKEAKWILEHFGTDVLDVCPIDRAVLAKRSFVTRWIDKAAVLWARI